MAGANELAPLKTSSATFWPQSDKSREREGSALAIKKSFSHL